MIPYFSLATARRALRPLAALMLVSAAALRAAERPGPFFEPEQPFFHTQVEVEAAGEQPTGSGNFVVRGILIPLGSGHCAVFDQELLRLAAVWRVPAGAPLVTLETMAQISYASGQGKAGAKHPRPTGPLLLTTGMHPGIGRDLAALRTDPRQAAREGDVGRGALPPDLARFEGMELQDAHVVLHYTVAGTAVSERLELRGDGRTQLTRQFEIGAHTAPLVLALGRGAAGPVEIAADSAAVTLSESDGEHVATVAPAANPQMIRVTFTFPADGSPGPGVTSPRTAGRRWPESVAAPVRHDYFDRNGFILDHIAVPEKNPWRRRMRTADLAFVSDDEAAVVTYDGDVWLVTGFANAAFAELRWNRFASGLHEPLAIAAPGGTIQVATKNGVVRLHDRDRNGEADWFENFSDRMIQSQTTRSFPLDMAMGPDGSTYVTQGGIVTQSGLVSGGTGTEHTGAFLKISPDGRGLEMFGRGAREPFLAVHPVTGEVTGTDQQGHFIPSSVCYSVRAGASFGFLENEPAKLTPPLVWIPHDQDTSSTSQVWLVGEKMGPWHGSLLHLSYGSGRLLLISPDFAALTPQGAVIPLELKTDLPLLHARMHPRGDAVFLAGFQIYGSQTPTKWALGRLRRGPTPVATAVAARSVRDGVVLTFAAPLDPASVQPARLTARAWNYRRSAAYGSGRYTVADVPGATPWGITQAVLSVDRTRVFVHLAGLPKVQQLEVRHDFQLADGTAARGVAYFTIHEPRPFEPGAWGFGPVDLMKAPAVAAQTKEPSPTAAIGKEVAQNFGCVACHSADGTTEGKVGPTWRGLFGAKRTFVDGSTETADALYLRDKILDPQQKKTKPGTVEMPSYRGVLSEAQVESLVLYIRNLAKPERAAPTSPRPATP